MATEAAKRDCCDATILEICERFSLLDLCGPCLERWFEAT